MKRQSRVCAALVVILVSLCGCGSDSDPESRVRELDIDAAGATLHVRLVGGSETGAMLIAIHGGPGNCSDTMLDLETLADEELCVLTYDQRGTGQSSKPLDGYAMERYVEDLDAVRSASGAPRVHLLGHSWGGVVALRYAAAYPERVRSIILMGSGPMTPAAVAAGQANLAERVAVLQAQGIIPQTPSSVTDLLPAYFSDPRFAMPDELANMSYVPAVQQATWAELEGYDHCAGLDRLTCPVLLVYGADDPFGAVLAGAAQDALVRASIEVVVLPECGHYWHEASEAFHAAVRQFVSHLP